MIVESGAETLTRFSDFRPDVILLDVNMPGMSGPEILQTLRDMEQSLVVRRS
ncbi:MAG: response regulator [Candidatus Obscuribacterales bacterium]|nr:response regulator [Candidatus Obscuribacterales bacterium]